MKPDSKREAELKAAVESFPLTDRPKTKPAHTMRRARRVKNLAARGAREILLTLSSSDMAALELIKDVWQTKTNSAATGLALRWMAEQTRIGKVTEISV